MQENMTQTSWVATRLGDNRLAFAGEPLTDEKLLYLCQRYGENARLWRQKFLGLLPEVYKRRLYARKGFSSIFEFAAKLAGANEEQVSRVLNLERKFRDKPDLHKALVNGEVSINKLARVASIATPENQEALLQQAKILPKSALEIFVKDEKMCCSVVPGHKLNGQLQILQDPQLPLQSRSDSELILSPGVKAQLLELQRRGIDINEIILEALKRREQDIEDEKRRLANEQEGVEATRPVPAKIQHVLNREYGTKCAMPYCNNDTELIHHELPFAMVKNHNPFFLKPLCKEHHRIFHGVQLAYMRNIMFVSKRVDDFDLLPTSLKRETLGSLP